MKLIYFSPVKWESYAQRPQHFINWFHKTYDADILWVNPYPSRFPKFSDFSRLFKTSRSSDIVDHSLRTPAWLQIVTPKALPVDGFPVFSKINNIAIKNLQKIIDEFALCENTFIVIGKPSHISLSIIKRRTDIYSIYDAMDDFPEFHSGFFKKKFEQLTIVLAKTVNQVWVSSSNLECKFIEEYNCRTVLKILNGCSISRNSEIYTLKATHKKSIIVGYVGSIASWFDWEIVIAMARSCPDVEFKLIGPCFNFPIEVIPNNISMKNAVEHQEAIAEIANFDIGLIPFKLNSLTHCVDPIKYYEYQSLGKPVLSTAFGEMKNRTDAFGIAFVNINSDFEDLISELLKCKFSTEFIYKFTEKNSWDSRFSETKHIFQ